MSYIIDGMSRFLVARGIVKSMPQETQLAFLGLVSDQRNDLSIRNEAMLLTALNYALPRMSYVGGVVREVITRNWTALQKSTRTEILNRVRTAIRDGRAGADLDVTDWKMVLELSEET